MTVVFLSRVSKQAHDGSFHPKILAELLKEKFLDICVKKYYSCVKRRQNDKI
jgi:hypothetical protein